MNTKKNRINLIFIWVIKNLFAYLIVTFALNIWFGSNYELGKRNSKGICQKRKIQFTLNI